MTTWLVYLLIGLGTGAVYAAIAMGTILSFRGSAVVNFAQGAMATFPALVFVELRDKGDLVLPIVILPHRIHLTHRLPLAPSFVIAVAIAALIGLASHAFIFHPLRNATQVAKVIASVGLNTALIGLAVLHFGAAPRRTAPILPSGVVRVFGRPIPQDRFWLAGLVCAAGAGLWALYRFTQFGLATRAAAENEKGAELMGQSPRFLGAANWVLASVVAGAAGILVTPVRGVGPFNYSSYLVAALAAALAARLRSFGVAIMAGIGIGMFEGLSSHLVSTRQVPRFLLGGFETVVPFVVIVGALVVFGATLPGRGTLLENRNPKASVPRLYTPTVALAVVIAAVVLLFGSSGLRLATIESCITAILILSIVLLAGYVGQVTLAELTFAGFSAFMLARFTTRLHLPFPLSPLAAIAVTTIVGTLASLPAVRIRGIQLAIVTVSAATAIEQVLFRSPTFTGLGGTAHVPNPRIFGVNLGIIPDGRGGYPNRTFGIMVLVVAVGCAVLVANVRRTATGRRMLAVRANERAAAASGINVPRTKLLGAGLGSFVASVSGVLMGYKFVDFSSVGFEAARGLGVVALAYLGGIATVSGAFVAGIMAPAGVLFTVLGNNSSDSQLLFSGIGLIVVAVKFPGGITSAGPAVRRLLARLATKTSPPDPPASGDELEFDLIEVTEPPRR